MSAEVLRRAASLMRERAEAYDPRGRIEVTAPSNVAHVRSWTPAVALAVADLLDTDAEATTPDDYDESQDLGRHMLLRVARAYLGESS